MDAPRTRHARAYADGMLGVRPAARRNQAAACGASLPWHCTVARYRISHLSRPRIST